VPPAYERVWYSPDPHGHLQAIGYDAKGRKQYRYHAAFREARDGHKYDRCVDFGSGLPLVRARVEADMALPGLPRDKVLAAIVRLLDQGKVRVGNEGYAKENKSFGATTLRNRHGAVRGDTVKLDYRGKSGKQQRVAITDKSLARIVRRCQDLPGQALFQYVGDDGEPHRVGSSEVNAYIQAAMGEGFSAKHFRTWGASVAALAAVRGGAGLKEMLAEVAEALGNTPAIARKSYIHPAIVEDAKESRVPEVPKQRALQYFSADERALLDYLEAAAS